nr:MAG TPA: hypothetical protein [Inoviridae sp.]
MERANSRSQSKSCRFLFGLTKDTSRTSAMSMI